MCLALCCVRWRRGAAHVGSLSINRLFEDSNRNYAVIECSMTTDYCSQSGETTGLLIIFLKNIKCYERHFVKPFTNFLFKTQFLKNQLTKHQNINKSVGKNKLFMKKLIY